jgi:hypothetical protein
MITLLDNYETFQMIKNRQSKILVLWYFMHHKLYTHLPGKWYYNSPPYDSK